MKYILNVLFYIIIFSFSIGAVFNSIHPLVDTMVFTSVFFSGLGLIMRINPPKIFKYYYFLIPLFIFVIMRATLYDYINMGNIINFFFKPIKILLIPYAAVVIVELISRYNKNYKKFILNALHFSFIINALVILLMFYNPSFKDAVYAYTTTGKYRSSVEYMFRMGAFSGATGGAILSVVQAFGTILSYFLLQKSSKLTSKIYYILSFVLCTYATTLVGRSGLWAIIILLPFSMLLTNRKKIKYAVAQISIIGIIAVSGIGIITGFINSLGSQDPLARSLGRTFSTFMEYEESGKFEDQTVGELQNHFLFPNDWETILVGNPEHQILTQYDRTLKSDIGYIRDLWSYGFIGSFIYILPVIIILLKTIRNKLFSVEGMAFIMITLSMFIFNAKEGVMYTRMVFSIYSILFALTYFVDKKNVNKVELKS